MSSHAFIGIMERSGAVEVVYLFAGLPQKVEPVLGAYTSAAKVRELLKLGDLSKLEKQVAPKSGTPHSFDHPAQDVTVAYHRDRGDKPSHSLRFSSWAALVRGLARADVKYVYLLEEKTGKWRTIDADTASLGPTDASVAHRLASRLP